MVSILLDGVTVKRSSRTILDRIHLRVDHAEFLVVIGASGSGKSSLLRVIAGLDTPDRGDVLFDGASMAGAPPAARDIAMVFQDEALYPRMTAGGNVGFPLRVRGVGKGEISRRVRAESRMLGIERFLEHLPSRLSAGHQQLVQAARALVRNPAAFLLDEPLSRMDSATRRRVRGELRLLQEGYRVTTVYATNDQEEAMVLGDRLAVLDHGRVRQVGAPLDLYNRPSDRLVAGLLGSPPMSFIEGRIGDGGISLGSVQLASPSHLPHGAVVIGVRPEHWSFVSRGGARGRVLAVAHLGSHAFGEIEIESATVTVRFDAAPPARGAIVQLRPNHFHLFSPEDGSSVAHLSI